MTCVTCGTEPCVNPSFCRTCRKADAKYRRAPDVERLRALLDDSVSLDRAYAALNADRPTPQATIEAIKQAGRDGGEPAISEPAIRERLARCDEAALAEIDRWLLARGVR
jgi:hypothetical protein